MQKGCVIGGIVLAVVGVILLVVFIGSYNKAIKLDEDVKNKWAQVDNQLLRRADLIPNLVNIVKGYAAHETEAIDMVTKSRAAYTGAKTVDEKVDAAKQMDSALARLLVVVENYPNLKADGEFMKLHDSVEGTENRIAVERMRYNDAVKVLNGFVRGFPGGFFARMAGVREAKYYEIPEAKKEVPTVDFSKTPAK
jgi:LemA protein